MRKLLLSLLLTLMIVPSAFALAVFEDVANTHTNYTAISYLKEEGVIGGYPDGTFRPNSTINRAEMMKLLVEGLGITPSATQYGNCFSDIHEEWFAKYVCYAKMQGWVDGYPDGTFGPGNSVLDVEAMKMILNAREVELDPDFVPLLFAGVPPDAWYRPYLVTAEKLNLTDKFTPGNNYTRAEVSEVIFRALVIEKADVSSFSAMAQRDVLNENIEKPAGSYEPAGYVDYSAEKRASYQGSRPFAIFFHASWCPICRVIEQDLKADLGEHPDGVLILQADYESEVDLTKEFSVTRQYWFVIFNADGEVTFSNNLFNASDVIEKIVESL
jgi:thiol-disulfide isomerase/thioredoxin